MQITNIPATPPAPTKMRVVAYARVSADKDAAFHSLEAQQEYYEEYVKTHPGWELVTIYSDNAVSGTVADRPEFQRMLADCRADKVDLVVTKSITRFARNTVVLLEAIRELKHLGIDVYFEKEEMHSVSEEGELLITLLAMYAEEEARSASENQKWRIKKKFEQGQTTVGRMLGYRLKDGKLIIVEDEAELVRRIFREFLAGKSIMAITKELTLDGIPARFSDVWNSSSIYHILTNEKYTGNMILQKTYSPDFRTKKQVTNHGKVPKYQVLHSHIAIISENEFAKVQERLAANRENVLPQSLEPTLFSGLLRCGSCGGSYGRFNNNTGKYKHPVWTCHRYNNLGKAVCPSQAIPESILVEKTKEVLGVEELTRTLLSERIAKITVLSPHRLLYRFMNGTELEVAWRHKSRRESWTPEMKQKARERALKQHETARNQAGNHTGEHAGKEAK